MSNRFNIDIRNLTEIMQINGEEKMVMARNLQTGEEYDESYDVLILSPGSKPIKPQISGIEEAQSIIYSP